MFFPQKDEGLMFTEALLGCLEETAPKEFGEYDALHIPYALKSVMRQLLCEGDGCSAKRYLENIINVHCKVHWQPHVSHGCNSEMTKRRCKLQFLRVLSGFDCASQIKNINNRVCDVSPALPCGLLYALYYLSCAQCGPDVVYTEIEGSWAHLFFFGAMTKDLQTHGDWVSPQNSEGVLRELRQNIVLLFSRNTSPECGTFALSFVDTCRLWILGDYHNVLEQTESLFLQTPNSEKLWNTCLLEMSFVNIMYEGLLFMHITAVVLTTNMGQDGSRCEIQTIIQRLFIRPHNSEEITGFMNRVFFLIHQELFSEDENDDDLECATGTKLGNFFLLLRIWLRAKRLTDSGQMESSRDLLHRALTELRNDGGVFLLPVQWLRKLFFVNCAALSDASTLLCFLREWESHEMRLSEVLYIAACPTLGAGGVHSPLLGSLFKGTDTRELVRAIERFHFSVQLPLLSQRLWSLRRRALDCHAENRTDLEEEMLFLCDVIVPLARGLAGSLELSFTDCAPHRLLFEAITIACDIQEDVLRHAAAFLQDDTSTSECTQSSGNDTGVFSDGANPVSDTDTTASDAWLKVNKTTLSEEELSSLSAESSLPWSSSSSWTLSSSLSLSACSSSTNLSFVHSQSVYWRAHRRTMRWLGILENSYAHLHLTVRICHLRMAAAAFDQSTAQLTRELFDSFGTNALVITHGARALFASLNIVAAEKHICKALQLYPHSAEVQKLYCFMCSNHIATDLLETKKGWSLTYWKKYRGLLPVRYTLRIDSTNAVNDKGVKWPVAHVIPVALSILSVIFFAASFTLHIMKVTIPFGRMVSAYASSENSNASGIVNNSMTNKGTNPNASVPFSWSFVLPCSGHLYFGLLTVVYAIVASTLSCYNAASSDDRFIALIYFLKVSMMQGDYVDDLSNRLVYSLRGVGLVNLVTIIQLVVKHTLLLFVFNNETCYVFKVHGNTPAAYNSTTYDADEHLCSLALIEWAVVCTFLIGPFTIFCIVFHNRAYRALRSSDIITGSVPTFITLFILDTTFFLISFPLLFVCSAVLEPILFMLSALFSLASSPLLEEHLPSVPSDALLSTAGFSPPRAAPAVPDYKSRAALFTAAMASDIRFRLRRSLPPRRWSRRRRHDAPLCCSAELAGGPAGADSAAARGASRALRLCLWLQRALCRRAQRSPLGSRAAVQSALLREAFAAVRPPQKETRGTRIRPEARAEARGDAEGQTSSVGRSPSGKMQTTMLYG